MKAYVTGGTGFIGSHLVEHAVYGPRDADIFLFFQMINRGVIPIVGDADKLLSLVHVKDLVAGMYTAAVSEHAIGAKAQKELSYRPTYFLEKGIQETADWYRGNDWL